MAVNAAKKIRTLHGDYLAHGRRFGIVVSRFNEALTSRLLEGALETLFRHGALKKDVSVVEVPGAFEVPFAAGRLIRAKKPDVVIVLAVVIRGETRHFDQVVRESARGIRELSQKTDRPIILGILAAENPAQALARTGIKHTNKGREWALAAIEMANLSRKLK